MMLMGWQVNYNMPTSLCTSIHNRGISTANKLSPTARALIESISVQYTVVMQSIIGTQLSKTLRVKSWKY